MKQITKIITKAKDSIQKLMSPNVAARSLVLDLHTHGRITKEEAEQLLSGLQNINVQNLHTGDVYNATCDVDIQAGAHADFSQCDMGSIEKPWTP